MCIAELWNKQEIEDKTFIFMYENREQWILDGCKEVPDQHSAFSFKQEKVDKHFTMDATIKGKTDRINHDW